MPSSTKDKKDVECYGVGDFPGSPVVKNPLSKARNMGSNTSQGTKIPQATGQLSPYATLREAYNQEPTHCSEAWEQSQKKKKRKENKDLFSALVRTLSAICRVQCNTKTWGQCNKKNISILKWLFKYHFLKIWRQRFGTSKGRKAMHMKMDKQKFDKQVFAARRNNGTQQI